MDPFKPLVDRFVTDVVKLVDAEIRQQIRTAIDQVFTTVRSVKPEGDAQRPQTKKTLRTVAQKKAASHHCKNKCGRFACKNKSFKGLCKYCWELSQDDSPESILLSSLETL